MKRTAAICVALVLSLVSSVDADYTWTDQGTWPKSWPAELEPLRKQSRTFEGPTLPLLHHAIPFTKRDEFESAWPHLLKIKSKGAPIVLRRGPSFWLGDKATAGVCVHTPPAGEAPIADGKDAKGNWEEMGSASAATGAASATALLVWRPPGKVPEPCRLEALRLLDPLSIQPAFAGWMLFLSMLKCYPALTSGVGEPVALSRFKTCVTRARLTPR